MKQELTEKQKKRIAGAAIVIFVLFTLLVGWVVGVPMVRFLSEPERFRGWVDQRGIWGRLAYIGMVILQVIVALIPGEPLEIGGGYAFGAVEGTILCLVGATAGSVLVFWLVRRFGMRLVEVFFPAERLRTLRFLQVSGKRELLFLVIFMVPGTPKDMLCYFAGITDMPWAVWLMICSLGRIPSVITSTIGGSALGEQNYWFAAASFAVALTVSGIGLLIYDRICKKNNK